MPHYTRARIVAVVIAFIAAVLVFGAHKATTRPLRLCAADLFPCSYLRQ